MIINKDLNSNLEIESQKKGFDSQINIVASTHSLFLMQDKMHCTHSFFPSGIEHEIDNLNEPGKPVTCHHLKQ